MASKQIITLVIATVFVLTFLSGTTAQAPASEPSAVAFGPSAEAITPDCMKNLFNLSGCLTYVQAGSNMTKPDKPCCPELSGIVESSPQCVCYYLDKNTTASYGLSIDVNRALNLLTFCHVSTSPASLCSVINGPAGTSSEGFISPGNNSTAFGPSATSHNSTGTSHNSTGFAIKVATGSSIAGIVVLIILVVCYMKRFSSKDMREEDKIEAFLKSHEFLIPKRYRYSDIKNMTNSFRDKLGKGGYGDVYKGKLLDGRQVAVKILNKLEGSGEEFMNEVASISRTSHVNVVTLLGFCFEGRRRRALIYDFMPNGSLEKFIFQEKKVDIDRQLKWETLYQIVVGIARGLAYLHRGCNTRILHFDIKPHNILLDDEFCPKISDFGLAKLCPQKESAISMTNARGTVGYIAPEVYFRNFGRVSHKSDVYSYGMMILEMVGGRRNINVEIDHTSEIYFPHWIYNRIELDELGLQGLTDEDDQERVRKMVIVSLWCIQPDPSNRPPMSRVVEMMEGNIVSLTIPPKPFLSSPPTSP